MEIEREVLFSMLHYPKDIEEFLSKVKMTTFSKSGLEILNLIIALKEKNTLNLNALMANLSENFKKSDYFGAFVLCEANPNYLSFIDIFNKKYVIRMQKKIANDLLKASDENVILDIEYLKKELEVQKDGFKNLIKWSEYYRTKPQSKVYKTNIPFIDNCFEGGFELGQLMLISGDPDSGKTMLGLQILENLSKITRVCFFSFEFPVEHYLKRKNESSSGLNAENFFIIDEGFDINEVANNIKELYKQKGVKFFLIDSQMRLTTPQARAGEEEESLKFSILARLCHHLNIFIFFIIQTSKSDEDTPLGSKKGAHEASIIVRLKRDKNKEEERTIVVKKNKQTGKHYKSEILFDPKMLKFYEPSQRELEIIYEMPNV